MSSQKSYVPNVAPKKMDETQEQEAARMQVVMTELRQKNGQFITKEEGKSYTLERRGENAEGGIIDLKKIPAVYFYGCKNCHYTIEHRVTKILMEKCENVSLTINGKVLTATVEIWSGANVTLNANTKVKTLQLDSMKGTKAVFKSKEEFCNVIWQDVTDLEVAFLDNASWSTTTGIPQMLAKYSDYAADAAEAAKQIGVDQFIVHLVPELGEGPQIERVVRLKNGFPSTEREAADWDKRNDRAKAAFQEKFLKDHGIRLNRAAGKKIGNNEPCPCNSGKKYKKCCRDKQSITGLADSQGARTFQTTKDGSVAVQKA